MLVRTYQARDLGRLIELTTETFGPFYEDLFRPLVGETIFSRQHGRWRDDYRDHLATLHSPEHHTYVAVAEIDKAIWGYVGWVLDPTRQQGRIDILAVAAAQRGQRVGSQLCEHAFGHMRTHGAVYVEVHTGGDDFHAAARGLYESLGCIQVPTAAYFREL